MKCEECNYWFHLYSLGFRANKKLPKTSVSHVLNKFLCYAIYTNTPLQSCPCDHANHLTCGCCICMHGVLLPQLPVINRFCRTSCCTYGVLLPQLPGGDLFGYQRYQVLHDSMLCTWGIVTSVTRWLPVVTFGYQRYQVVNNSMLCTWSMVTSVTWWLPVVTMCYQRYQVLHDSMLCTWSIVISVTWWLHLVTSVTRYCMILCYVRGVWLPGGYQVTGIAGP